MDDDAKRGEGLRARILEAASTLVAEGGPEAATTRAVATAAGVQAPAIYRIFGDKQGLLGAVVEDTIARYVAQKAARAPAATALEELRIGWDAHVAFGLSNPHVFVLMSVLPEPTVSALAAEGTAHLRRRVQRLAREGHLRVTEDAAVELLRAMGTGVVLTLLQMPEQNPSLSGSAFDAVLAAISGQPDAVAAGAKGNAMALRASLDETRVLSAGERLLLAELLDRIAAEATLRVP